MSERLKPNGNGAPRGNGRGRIVQAPHGHGIAGRRGVLGISAAPAGDPALFVRRSMEDNAFWLRQIKEHALFLKLLTPFWDAEAIRAAEAFMAVFETQEAAAARLPADPPAVGAFNVDTMTKVGRFSEFKKQLLQAVASGRPTLAFPTFLDHVSREEDYFIDTLARLNAGQPRAAEPLMAEEHDFWATLMREHAQFIAHLLDPAESALIARANGYADRYDRLLATGRRVARDNAALTELFNNDVALTTEYFDFKTIALALIQGAEVLSIIHPTLADHVRREAGKFLEVLNEIGQGRHE